ncbi:MAG: ATP-dependent Clp protease proteolytic subunit [Clostridiales bacterium]|jgi:ATP-dependent protease ClpP protease subunit|nr:ATP-dependent Clp protease proteolytic subunit [Clostridiales bacterium]
MSQEINPNKESPDVAPQLVPCAVQPDPVKEYGTPSLGPIKNPRGNVQFLSIVGQIEGHMILPPQNKTTKYEHVIPQLFMAAENVEVDGMLVLLNTVGGDVEAGLAIAELISHFGKPTVSLVIGGGHSIGVPLAVSANYSFIAPSAAMTIHPVRMNGTVVGAPQTYDYFNKMQERVSDFIVSNSDIEKERLKALMMDTSTMAMDIGSILIGEEAVRENLINETGGLSEAMEKLYELIQERKRADYPQIN